MIRKFIRTLGTIVFLFATSNAYSFMDGFSVGVTGSIIEIEASGTETLKTNGTVVKESVDNTTGIGSIFAEYSWNGFTFGLDYIPVDADISNKVHSRADTDHTNAAASAVNVTNSAQASIEDHITAYVEYPLFENSYLKAGYVNATVDTQESLGTGSTYGNETLDGYIIGLGLKADLAANLFMKAEVNYTDYNNLEMTSSDSNKIEADLDTNGFMLAVGYSF